MRRMIGLAVAVGLALTGFVCGAARAGDAQNAELTLEVRGGKQHHPPIVAVWLENTKGGFIKTIRVISRAARYYGELKTWNRVRPAGENRKAVDAVVGATINWGASQTIQVPLRVDVWELLSGNVVICIESIAKDDQAPVVFRIPVPAGCKGGAFEHEGGVSRAVLRVPGGDVPKNADHKSADHKSADYKNAERKDAFPKAP